MVTNNVNLSQDKANNASNGVWILQQIGKILPLIISSLIIGSVVWIGSNSMQTNLTLAVMSNDISILKDQVKASTVDKYTSSHALQDKALFYSEINHLKTYNLELKGQIINIESRLLDLERVK